MDESKLFEESGEVADAFQIYFETLSREVGNNEIVRRAAEQLFRNTTQSFEGTVPEEFMEVVGRIVGIVVRSVVERSSFDSSEIGTEGWKERLAMEVDGMLLKNLHSEDALFKEGVGALREYFKGLKEDVRLRDFQLDLGKLINAIGQVAILRQFRLDPNLARASDQEVRSTMTRFVQEATTRGVEILRIGEGQPPEEVLERLKKLTEKDPNAN